MSALGLATDISLAELKFSGEESGPTAALIGHILALAHLKDGGDNGELASDAIHRLWHATGDNYSNQTLSRALNRWIELPLMGQREDLRAYVGEGFPAELQKRLDRGHYRLSSLWPDTNPGAALFLCSIEVNLAFLRAECGGERSGWPAPSWRVLDLLEAIEQSQASLALTLDTEGERLRISPDHLGRLFKGATGVTLHTFLHKYRALRTAEMLNETAWTLEEIARVFGHSQSSHLVREFRHQIGVTPGQFRRLQRKPPHSAGRELLTTVAPSPSY